MIQDDTDARQAEVNALIEAFEAAYASHRDVNLTEFLPPKNHSLYLEARRELLRVDLELNWDDGRRHRIEDYESQFPDLLQDPATLQDLAFEEFRLRLLAGEEPSIREYEEKYGVATAGWAVGSARPAESNAPRNLASFLNLAHTLSQGDSRRDSWHSHVAQALLREHPDQTSAQSAFLLAQAMTALPTVGSTFLSFQLIAELGHGSYGRVYLARQGDLASRFVALKITVDLLGEEQKLAQLQHTNVVPIYSAHQAGPLQAVCMPYFGATTLADVIRDLQGRSMETMSGKDICQTVRNRRAALQAQVKESDGASRQGLETDEGCDRGWALKVIEQSRYVDAILFIAEGVTEGLIHAHEHGILHRDLKPANVLLTDEGRPMLVDFNLSDDTKLHGILGERQVAGTLPYMAPEHLEAMQGKNRVTDARSDIYALGVVLFELLTGRRPFQNHTGNLAEILPPMIADCLQGPPRLRCWNSAVSPAVESVVRQCLQPDPARRYQSAAQLREDLQRQRHHRPLRFAPEPSIREWARKWVRRHPRMTSPISIVALISFLVLCFAVPFAWQQWQLAVENARLRDSEQQKVLLAERRVKATQQKVLLAEGTVKATQSTMAALTKFHDFEKTRASSRPIMEIVSVMQILPEAWPYQEKRLAEATTECRRSLQTYHVLDDVDWQRRPEVHDLPLPERNQLCLMIAELLYALAHADHACLTHYREQARQFATAVAASTLPGHGHEIWGAWEATVQEHFRTADRLNDLACACFNNQKAPWYLARQKSELGLLKEARTAEPLTEKPSSSGDERYWAAGTLALEGKYADAIALLTAATEQSPDHAGALLLLAWCHYNKGDSGQALSCYDGYIKLRPEGIWGFYNRGLLFLREKTWSSAESDFSKVLEKCPDLAWAYTHRAAARKGMRKNPDGVINDLTMAIKLAPSVPEFYLLRSQAHYAAGNWERAESDRQRFLLYEPNQFVGWLYRGIAKLSDDPRGALADFEKALALNPRDPLALFNKACLLSDDLRRPLDAIPVLDEIVELDPHFLNARFKRGILLAKAGFYDRAVEDAEQLTRLDPTPSRCYEAASIFALTSQKDQRDAGRALLFLRYALRHGYGVYTYQADPNLRPLANLKSFRLLADGLKILGAGAEPPFRP